MSVSRPHFDTDPRTAPADTALGPFSFGALAAPISIGMNELSQLASAMLAIAFAAVMLVAGQLFIEYRANKYPLVQVVTASKPL